MQKTSKYRVTFFEYIYGKDCMKGFLITAITLLLGALECSASDTPQVPAHGEWKGQPIGTWTVTRTTYSNTENPTSDEGKLYKTLLLGEVENRNTIVVWGEADEQSRYQDPTTVSGAWSEDNPIPIPSETRDDVLIIDGKEVPVLVKVFCPTPDVDSGVVTARTVWELKSHPGFVLMLNLSQRDSFRGETYEYLITQQVAGIGHTNVLGKMVRYFRIRHDETVNGRTTSRIELLKSDELPGSGLIQSVQTRYAEDGLEKSSVRRELVALGCSPEDASRHWEKQQLRRMQEGVALDSETGRVNVAHLMRQGMPESIAQEIVTKRISIKDIEYGEKKTDEIAVEWSAYKADPSEKNRDAFIKKFQYIGSNPIGYIVPSLEQLLLDISRAEDPMFRIAALTCLIGYVSVLYAPKLEDALIQSKQYTNSSAIWVLSTAKWGTPRRVLSQDGVDIRSFPLKLIPYAPESLAIKDLMSRFEAGDKFQQSQVLERLVCYSTPEVRTLFTQLANELVSDDFIWNKTDRSYLVRHIIEGAANLNIENTSDLFLKWMDWNSASDDGDSNTSEDTTTMKDMIDLALIVNGGRLRDPRVNSHISKHIATKSALGYLSTSDEGMEKLGDIKLDMTPASMEEMLSTPVLDFWSGKFQKGEQLYGLFGLFRFSANDVNLAYMMDKLAPDWTLETDYAAMAIAQNKYWYKQKMEIQPLNVRAMHPQILADVLPSFGDQGARILIQLCGSPGLRRYMIPSLMEITHRREEAREYLSLITERGEDDVFRNGLVLWCLGVDSYRAECEKYIRYEALHGSRANKARRALRYLPFETVYPLLLDIRSNHPNNDFPFWAGTALSYHKNRKSAELILSLWNDEISSKLNPEYGEMFNRLAGQNFGMDRSKIKKWILTLPPE